MNSIYEILIKTEPSFAEVFGALSDLGERIGVSNKDVYYRFPSQAQALSSYQQAREMSADPEPVRAWMDLGPEASARIIRAGVYDQGKAPHLLGVFLWTKKAVVSSQLETISALCSTNDAISLLLVSRSIFESIGVALLLQEDLDKLLTPLPVDINDKWQVHALSTEAISKRGKATRIDWESFLSSSFREGKKKSYKQKADTVDLAARDLLNGIDKLDKRTKGARKAYEFLSEFAHPNIGAHNLLVSDLRVLELSDQVILYERKYSPGSPELGFHDFRKQIREMLDILVDSVVEFIAIIERLEKDRRKLDRLTKAIVKRALKNHPLAFVLAEPCPCLSGRSVEKCCGPSLRKIHRKHGIK